ncbi:MAG: hypothetical protein Q9203_007065 [Teloschistes exilis]
MSDHYLPSPLVDDNTFTKVEEEAAGSPDEEEAMVDSLKTRLDLLRVVRAEAEDLSIKIDLAQTQPGLPGPFTCSGVTQVATTHLFPRRQLPRRRRQSSD